MWGTFAENPLQSVIVIALSDKSITKEMHSVALNMSCVLKGLLATTNILPKITSRNRFLACHFLSPKAGATPCDKMNTGTQEHKKVILDSTKQQSRLDSKMIQVRPPQTRSRRPPWSFIQAALICQHHRPQAARTNPETQRTTPKAHGIFRAAESREDQRHRLPRTVCGQGTMSKVSRVGVLAAQLRKAKFAKLWA